jgi:hypothetical protein
MLFTLPQPLPSREGGHALTFDTSLSHLKAFPYFK